MVEARLSWIPWGALRLDGVPDAGALVADYHAVWQVVEVVELAHDSDWPGARTHELILAARTGPAMHRTVPTSRYSAWWVYPQQRFPVCSCCGEPAPCRAQLVEDAAQHVLEDMARFSQEGRCPACLHEVTNGAAARTFAGNLRVPLGPPVTFHSDRPVCRSAAAVYAREWEQAGSPVAECQGGGVDQLPHQQAGIQQMGHEQKYSDGDQREVG